MILEDSQFICTFAEFKFILKTMDYPNYWRDGLAWLDLAAQPSLPIKVHMGQRFDESVSTVSNQEVVELSSEGENDQFELSVFDEHQPDYPQTGNNEPDNCPETHMYPEACIRACEEDFEDQPKVNELFRQESTKQRKSFWKRMKRFGLYMFLCCPRLRRPKCRQEDFVT